MKLNDKGFAISGILYSILVIFMIVLFTILGTLGSRKVVLDKTKMEVFNMLNQESEATTNQGNFKSVKRSITVDLNEYKLNSVEPVLHNLTVNNKSTSITLDSCEVNYTCNCNIKTVSCILNSNTCEVIVSNVNENTTCELKYLQN